MTRFSAVTLLIVLLSGCALQFPDRENRPLTPRESAAMQLTQEGRQYLNAGKPDNAIRLFEQAIGLDPNYGQCYYYIAQAWMAKGVVSEARQFNSLAGDYLKDDEQWMERVGRQEYRIEEMAQ